MTEEFKDLETVEQAINHLENYCRENYNLEIDIAKAWSDGNVEIILIDQSDVPDMELGEEVWRFRLGGLDIDGLATEEIDIISGSGEVCVF